MVFDLAARILFAIVVTAIVGAGAYVAIEFVTRGW